MAGVVACRRQFGGFLAFFGCLLLGYLAVDFPSGCLFGLVLLCVWTLGHFKRGSSETSKVGELVRQARWVSWSVSTVSLTIFASGAPLPYPLRPNSLAARRHASKVGLGCGGFYCASLPVLAKQVIPAPPGLLVLPT